MRRALMGTVLAGCTFGAPGGPSAGGAGADAAAFDPATCPATYDVALASSPGSRYRIIRTNAVFRSQHTQCAAGGLGHLIAIETETERAEVAARLLVGPQSTIWYYTAAVQKPGAGAADAAWSWLIGGEILPGLWGIFSGRQQPNDADGTEDDSENLAVLDTTQGKLLDVSGMSGYGAVCECDGKSLVPALEAQIP